MKINRQNRKPTEKFNKIKLVFENICRIDKSLARFTKKKESDLKLQNQD